MHARNSLLFRSAARISALFFLAALSTGCYSVSHLTRVPQTSDAIARVAPGNGHKLPAFVSSISVTKNQGSANTSKAFDRRFLAHLQQADYFSDVVYSIYAKRPEPPFVDLKLRVDEHEDLNMGANMTKAFFTGFTLFLLAPVLPNSYDFDTTFALSATWPNGTQREYRASCAANAYGTYPYHPTAQKFIAAKGEATEKCLDSVINQLTSDKVNIEGGVP
jgi:hypothetical protein